MKLPLIIVNFKAYEQATGDAAVQLALVHEKVAKETGASIGVAVNALDLVSVCDAVNIPVFAQHVDAASFGSKTGHILPEMVKAAGAFGTLLNHAEFPLNNADLSASIKAAKEADLFVVACSEDVARAEEIVEMDPDMIAVEPPELIGGDVSVSKADPGIIEKSAAVVGENRLLVGAGVKTKEDVSIGLSLGASGVLLASGVVKSQDPYGVLLDLVSGLG